MTYVHSEKVEEQIDIIHFLIRQMKNSYILGVYLGPNAIWLMPFVMLHNCLYFPCYKFMILYYEGFKTVEL